MFFQHGGDSEPQEQKELTDAMEDHLKTLRLLFPFLITLIVSCGATESFTNPFVSVDDITQTSECRKTPGEEDFSYDVEGDRITYRHSNILLPENSVIGIADQYGNASFNTFETILVLDADEENINLSEKIMFSKSSKLCYYDLKVVISNVSGGEYSFNIFDSNGKLIKQWEEVRVR